VTYPSQVSWTSFSLHFLWAVPNIHNHSPLSKQVFLSGRCFEILSSPHQHLSCSEVSEEAFQQLDTAGAQSSSNSNRESGDLAPYMGNRTKFEDLSDDLLCMVLQKLSGWDRRRRSIKALASVACVSSRCSRLVKERASGAWEGVCRKAAPGVCMHLAPSGGSPRDAGWASVAKLLAWCPGHRKFSVIRKAETAIEDSHMNYTWALEFEGVPDEDFFSDASKCRAAYVLRCAHADFHAGELRYGMDGRSSNVTISWIYRGFIGDLQAWAADVSGINLFGAEGSVEEGSAGSEEAKVVCPFCPSLVQILPKGAIAPPFAFANFVICTSGHFHGLVSFQRVYWNFLGSMMR
jgi:hypothetical protein